MPRFAHSTRFESLESLESRRLMCVQHAGEDFQVNQFTPGGQGGAAVSADALGNFVVAWSSGGQDGDGSGVYARRYDAAGQPRGPEFQVNTTTANHQGDASVAMDDDGDFVVVWESHDTPVTDVNIYGQRFDASGARVGEELRVNTFTPGLQRDPSVAIDADGDFAVAWQSQDQEGGGGQYGIAARRYSAAGVPTGDDFIVNTFTTALQIEPAIAMSASGAFVVVWTGRAQTTTLNSIFAQRFDASGARAGGETRLDQSPPGIGGANSPVVAMDANGDFLAAWVAFPDQFNDLDIRARRFAADGTPRGDEFRANTTTSGRQENPAVAMDDAGNALVTWNTQHDSDVIAFQRYNAAGIAQGGELRANLLAHFRQRFPAVAWRGDGGAFVMAWGNEGQDGSSGSVYARRFVVTPGPAVSQAHFALLRLPHAVNVGFTQDVSASLTAADVTLRNLTTQQPVPLDQFSLAYDPSTNVATVTYAGPGGILPDGRYRLTLDAAGVRNGCGDSLPDNLEFDFFFLQGDANRDGRVSLLDFNILAAHFGRFDRLFTQGDFNYDGQVTLLDFDLLAGRFGTALGPVTAVRGAGLPRRIGEEIDLFEHANVL